MPNTTYPRLFALFACILLSSDVTSANRTGAFCANPRGTAPSLSFTLTTNRPGDMDRICRAEVLNAKSMGFTTIALVPTVAYDTESVPPVIMPGSGLNPGEVDRCLEVIWQAGLDLVYQPHVDSRLMYETGSTRLWRGRFDLSPNANYESELFAEFTEWLTRHNADISSQLRNVDVIIAAELERSTNERPAEWLDFARRYRQHLYAQGVGTRVRIGINPNWYPTANLSAANCAAFRQLIQSVDFVAPSFYGNWAEQINDGAVQVHQNRSEMIGMMSIRGRASQRCVVPEMATIPFAIGEFGITGAELRQSDHGNQINDEAFVQRRQIFSNLLSWARTQENTGTHAPHYLNLWALGEYDPLGVRTRITSRTRPDPEIARMIREYSAWRCPGIQLP